jgi:hypothetical protein
MADGQRRGIGVKEEDEDDDEENEEEESAAKSEVTADEDEDEDEDGNTDKDGAISFASLSVANRSKSACRFASLPEFHGFIQMLSSGHSAAGGADTFVRPSGG